MRSASKVLAGLSLLLFTVAMAVAEEELLIGEKPLPILLKQLRSENRGIQLRAAQALISAPASLQEKIIPQVTAILKSERENDRFVAAQVLGEYGPVAKSAVPELMPLLKGSQFERNRAAAAKALGQILKDSQPSDEIERVTDALVKKVTEEYDKYPDVRREAAKALGMIGPAAKKCIPLLDKVLMEYGVGVPDEDYRLIRRATAWTLGRMGAHAAGKTDILIALMHKDLWRSPEYVEAMGCIGPVHENVVRNIMDVIEPQHDAMRAVVEAYVALEKFGPRAAPAVPLLCRMVKEGNLRPAVALQVPKTLKAIGPAAAESVPLLANLAKSGVREITPEQHEELRKRCAEAIEALGGAK